MRSIFKINVFTYIYFVLAMLAGYFREIFIVYFILIVHELGHFFLMKLMGVSIRYIVMYPYGGMIKSNMLINMNSFKVILISLGGILIQLILLILCFILFDIGVIDKYYYDIFYKYNIYIILFNLLPIYPLDGFKILNSVIDVFLSFKRSLYVSFFINIVCLILFFIYLYVYGVSNYVIVVFLLVNLFSYIKDMRYILNKFYLERIIYDIEYSGLVSVSSIGGMYKNRFNYINGVSEKSYLVSKYR